MPSYFGDVLDPREYLKIHVKNWIFLFNTVWGTRSFSTDYSIFTNSLWLRSTCLPPPPDTTRHETNLMEVILLPLLDLCYHFIDEVVPDARVQVAPPVGFPEDALPRRFRRAVLRSLLDHIVPLFRPSLQALRVVPLHLGTFHDERHQVVAELVAVFNSLRGTFVIARFPEGVCGGYQHVVIAVVRHDRRWSVWKTGKKKDDGSKIIVNCNIDKVKR